MKIYGIESSTSTDLEIHKKYVQIYKLCEEIEIELPEEIKRYFYLKENPISLLGWVELLSDDYYKDDGNGIELDIKALHDDDVITVIIQAEK